jgi:hypothetical protein
MHSHSPNCLQGPLSWSVGWWFDQTTENTDAEIRHGLVQRVRREIAEGRYETPEKWDLALDRLFQRLSNR